MNKHILGRSWLAPCTIDPYSLDALFNVDLVVAPFQRPRQSATGDDAAGPRASLGLAATIVLAACSGCASIPEGRAAVDEIEFDGNETLSSDDLSEHLATAESPRFLGLFDGVVFDYEVYDRFVLQRDLQRVERYYRARGFYQARVRAGRVFYTEEDHVRVVIEVEEGPRTYVRKVMIDGLRSLPEDVRDAVESDSEALLARGDPFDEDVFRETEEGIRRALTDRGYAFAEVERKARVDLPKGFADVRFSVDAGPLAKFGAVTIEGLGKIPEDPVRRAVNIDEGEPYSTATLDDAEQAVLDLGVFRSVEIEPDLPESPPEGADPVVPVRVRTEPSDLRGVRLGGGVELDVIRTDVHLLAGWEHQNFFGGLRRFSVEFKPGLVFYPTRLPDLQKPTHFLPEEKFNVELEQPGFIEPRTRGFIRGEFNIFPLLLSPDVDEDAPILGYRELRGAVGLRRRMGRFFVSPSENVIRTTPFTYDGMLDPALEGVLISYLGLETSFDLRDDPIQPHKGAFFSNNLEYAGVGGDARDVKVRPEARFFIPLAKRFTWALRATTGFLFPQNYGETLESNARAGMPPPGVDRAQWVRDTQLLYFRAFFSGGPNSNRGYPLRGIGPHGIVPFFAPGLQAQQIAQECDDPDSEFDARCSLPLGGMTLWEASAEIRFAVTDVLSVATFCDASDVSQGKVELRFLRPHLSCGLGARYGTPVGPIRLDIGYRIPGVQVLEEDIPPSRGDPGTLFGLPIALNIGVGEAF